METTFTLLDGGKIEERYYPYGNNVACYRIWLSVNALHKYRRVARLNVRNARSLNAQFVAAGLRMPFMVISNRRVELA